jgi:hypothetical protein
MNIRGITQGAWLRAFVGGISLAAAAHAGLGYLPLVGPPPLRLLTVKPPTLAAPVNLSTDTNLAAVLAATDTIKLPASNTVAAFGQTNSTDDVLSIALGAGLGVDDPTGPAIFGMASPDFLNITPEILATYFHPVAHATNAVPGLVVPAPVIFMPPQIKSQNPSSHAEYIVK